MITTGRAAYQKECRYAEYAGLSTDNKLDPAIASVLQNGDTFKEIDTGVTFKYNAASGQWVEQPASGGGGGSGDYLSLDGGMMNPDAVISGTDTLEISLADGNKSAVIGLSPEGVTVSNENLDVPTSSIRVIEDAIEIKADTATVTMNGTGIDFSGTNITGLGSLTGKDGGEIAVETTLDMNNHNITNVAEPVQPNDVATKQYVDNNKPTNADYSQNDSSAADYIKNRPFYAEPWITWDGSTEGREVVNVPDIGDLIQISTETPTQEELLGASVVLSDGSKQTLSADDFQSGTNILNVIIGEGAYITYADNVDVGGLVIPKKGFYVMKSIEYPDYPYLVSLQGSKTVYPIDPKFIQKPFFISADSPIGGSGSYYRIYLPGNKERNKEITMEDVDESLLNLLINGIIKHDTTGSNLRWYNVLSISGNGPSGQVTGYTISTDFSREIYVIGEPPVR